MKRGAAAASNALSTAASSGAPATGSSHSTERLRKLEDIEVDLAASLQSAAHAMQELAKEKPSLKQVR